MSDVFGSPARKSAAVTASDVTVVNARALYVGTAGNLTVIMADDASDTPVLFANAPVGYHPISAKKVMSTGTAASGIVALF